MRLMTVGVAVAVAAVVAAAATGEIATDTNPSRALCALRCSRGWIRIPRTWAALAVSTLGLALVSATCAPYQNVGIDSRPAAAEVFVDGFRIGQTPVRIPIGTLSDHKVYLKKEGYRPELVILTLREPPDRLNFLTPPDIFVTLVPLDDRSIGSDLQIEPEED